MERTPVKWKDDAERGDFGRWLTEKVGDETYDWLAAQMEERGHKHGADYYRAMAGGSKPPGKAIRRALLEFFGEPEALPAPRGDALAQALSELAAELRAARQAREEYQVRLEAVEAAVKLLMQRDAATPPGPAAPARTVG